MDASQFHGDARRGRWAVAALFFLNGFIVGSWAPQIPELVTRLAIGETVLGLLILVFGIGAVTLMPVAGVFMARLGSRRVLLGFAVVLLTALPLVVLAPSVPLTATALFMFGGFVGAMDVAMNSNAVAVEKKLSQAIMSSSHGFWSLGGFFGAGVGGFMIQGYGALTHALVVAALMGAVFALAARHVIDDPVAPAAEKSAPMRLPRHASIYLIGLVALFAMIPEGGVLDWAALYLRKELGASIATAGLAFSFFAGAMATLRFAGDGVRNRFGAVKTMRVSAVIAAIGIFVGGIAHVPWLAIAAFAFAGIGIANIVPIAFSAAGNQPGMASSTGMSVVTTMGYSGILLAPSAIGYAAERVGFPAVYVALSGLLVIVFLLAPLVRSADFKPTPAKPELEMM